MTCLGSGWSWTVRFTPDRFWHPFSLEKRRSPLARERTAAHNWETLWLHATHSPVHPDLLRLFFITLGLELSDTKVYEPEIRALLGTASHYCRAVCSRIGNCTVRYSSDPQTLKLAQHCHHLRSTTLLTDTAYTCTPINHTTLYSTSGYKVVWFMDV